MPDIFREEGLREQELQCLGAVQVVRPSYFAPLVALALLLALILIAFCIFAETSKSTQLKGMLIPREGFSHVSARLNGRVKDLLQRLNCRTGNKTYSNPNRKYHQRSDLLLRYFGKKSELSSELAIELR